MSEDSNNQILCTIKWRKACYPIVLFIVAMCFCTTAVWAQEDILGDILSVETPLPGGNFLNHKNSKFSNHFEMYKEREVYGRNNGMLMVCPAHRHGTQDEALAKLAQSVDRFDKNKKSTIWVCRANQKKTLEKFAPLVEQVILNPIVHTSDDYSDVQTKVWPGVDQPFINNMRDLVKLSSNKRLIACLDLSGEPNHFDKRQATFEEIQWMAYATFGSGFHGITWRRTPSKMPFYDRLKSLDNTLASCEIGRASQNEVAEWVKGPNGVPLTTRRVGQQLYVILLNPEYMNLDSHGHVRLPVNSSPQIGTITLDPPPNTEIVSAKYLSGRRLRYKNVGSKIRANYSFQGGGVICIFQLKK